MLNNKCMQVARAGAMVGLALIFGMSICVFIDYTRVFCRNGFHDEICFPYG